MKLDWEKFGQVVAPYQALPAWKKWALLLCCGVGVFLGPFAFHSVGKLTVGSKSLGLAQTVTLADQPVLFFAIVAVVEVVCALSLIVMTWVFFFHDPSRPET
jgi:hypothetical protein